MASVASYAGFLVYVNSQTNKTNRLLTFALLNNFSHRSANHLEHPTLQDLTNFEQSASPHFSTSPSTLEQDLPLAGAGSHPARFSFDEYGSVGSDYSPSIGSVRQAVLMPRPLLGHPAVTQSQHFGRDPVDESARPSLETVASEEAHSSASRPAPSFRRHSASASLSSTASTSTTSEDAQESLLPGQRRGQRIQSYLAPKVKLNGPPPWAAEGPLHFARNADAAASLLAEQQSMELRPKDNRSQATSPDTGRVSPHMPEASLRIKDMDRAESLGHFSTTPGVSPEVTPKLNQGTWDEGLGEAGDSPQPARSTLPSRMLADNRRSPNGSSHTSRSVSPVHGLLSQSASCAQDTSFDSIRRRPGASLPGSGAPFLDSEGSSAGTAATHVDAALSPSASSHPNKPVRLISLQAAQAKAKQSAESVRPTQHKEPQSHVKSRKSGFLKMFSTRKDGNNGSSNSSTTLAPPQPATNASSSLALSPAQSNWHLQQENHSTQKPDPLQPPSLKIPSKHEPDLEPHQPIKAGSRSAPPTRVAFAQNSNTNEAKERSPGKLGAPSLNLRPISMFSDNFAQEMLFRAAGAVHNQSDSSESKLAAGNTLEGQATSGSEMDWRLDNAAAAAAGLSSPASLTSSGESAGSIFDASRQRSRGLSEATTPTTAGLTASSGLRGGFNAPLPTGSLSPGMRSGSPKPELPRPSTIWELEATIKRLEMELDFVRQERDGALQQCAQVRNSSV